MPSPTPNPIESGNTRSSCVILVSPGETPPQPLINLLREQSPHRDDLTRVEHPLLAMARLAVLERDRQLRREHLGDEWPPQVHEKTILVVVNRDAWRDLSPLFTTIKTLLPAVGIWLCFERIAIEIHAGDEDAAGVDADVAELTDDSITDDPTGHDVLGELEPAADTTTAPPASDELANTELTEAELHDLLGFFEGIDADPDPDFDDDPRPSGPGGSPPS